MAVTLLQFSLSTPPSQNFTITAGRRSSVRRSHCLSYFRNRRTRTPKFLVQPRDLNVIVSKAVEINAPIENSEERRVVESSILLDVAGMMCGGCVARVKGVITADERVEAAVVNMLTETAAVRLKPEAEEWSSVDDVAEGLVRRLTECGFEARQRVSGKGVGERVRKWKEMAGKKRELVEKSRKRVVLAWSLVALCCGSHASHILHSLGIHIAHGGLWDVLHNSYVKGALALGALLGPGRDLLYDGIRAFVKGSPNMNSLVGFGSVAAFIISAVSLFSPGLEWDASFFDEPHAGHASWFCAAGTFSGGESQDPGLQ